MQNNISRESLCQTKWEILTDKETLQKLNTNKEGLSQAEASQRLISFGENKLPESKKEGFIKRFLMQFNRRSAHGGKKCYCQAAAFR